MEEEKENIYSKISNWFDENKKFAFIIAVVIGIITHINMITGQIMTQDGLWNSMQYYNGGAWEVSLGRWGILLVGILNNFVAIPSAVTVMSVVVLAISAIFVVDLLDLKSKISIFITSVFIVVTPTLTITLLYVYTALAYCVNFLLAVLTIWFIYKFKYKKIGIALAIATFSLVMGIYQSYIGVTIGMCVIYNILQLMKDNSKFKDLFIDILKAVCVVIIGAGLYYVITMAMLNKYNLELSAYQGANNISIKNILENLDSTILLTYKDFLKFFFGDSIIFNKNYSRDTLWGIAFIVSGIGILISLLKIKEEKRHLKIIKIALILIVMLMLPIFLNIITIIIGKSNIYALTASQMILIVPMILSIIEKLNLKLFDISIWGMLIIVMVTYYVADNASYAALQMTYNQNYSIALRIVDRVETLEEYNNQMPVMLAGMIDETNFERRSNIYNYTLGFGANNTVLHGSYSGQIGTWHKFLEIYLGKYFPMASDDSYHRIVNTAEFKEMTIFPQKDSVKIIDGIVVVKLKNEPAMPW